MCGRLMIAVLVGVLSACATPTEQLIQQGDYQRSVIDGKGFKHVVYLNEIENQSDTLHIYIEGDGAPFVNQGRMVAADPTSTSPVMLELMLNDDTRSAYIGRPCYDGMASENGCDPRFWTHARYSDEVVMSMVAVVEKLAQQLNSKHIVLLGHSGGGALAVLMAPYIADTKGVVTLAGNLDIESWANEHAYTPLEGSMNPAAQDVLPESIVQHHYLGSDDRIIKQQDVRAFVQRQSAASFYQIDGIDHGCCWSKYWFNILNTLSDQINESR